MGSIFLDFGQNGSWPPQGTELLWGLTMPRDTHLYQRMMVFNMYDLKFLTLFSLYY